MNAEAKLGPQTPHLSGTGAGEMDLGPECTKLPSMLGAVLGRRDQLLARVFAGRGLGRLLGLLLAGFALLNFAYGFVMGIDSSTWQAISSGLKIPLLYLLSLVVCLPVLHVINVLMGSRLSLAQTLATILVAFNLNAILLAAFAPIVLFFMLTGSDYHFLKLLHVAVMTFSGFVGMLALHRGLVAMCEHSNVYPRKAVNILLLWIMVFGFVGTQMAWTLRPFLGAPDLPFEWFRHGGSGNFYQAIWQAILHL
jgi:hypothetical protein